MYREGESYSVDKLGLLALRSRGMILVRQSSLCYSALINMFYVRGVAYRALAAFMDLLNFPVYSRTVANVNCVLIH